MPWSCTGTRRFNRGEARSSREAPGSRTDVGFRGLAARWRPRRLLPAAVRGEARSVCCGRPPRSWAPAWGAVDPRGERGRAPRGRGRKGARSRARRSRRGAGARAPRRASRRAHSRGLGAGLRRSLEHAPDLARRAAPGRGARRAPPSPKACSGSRSLGAPDRGGRALWGTRSSGTSMVGARRGAALPDRDEATTPGRIKALRRGRLGPARDRRRRCGLSRRSGSEPRAAARTSTTAASRCRGQLSSFGIPWFICVTEIALMRDRASALNFEPIGPARGSAACS